MTKQEVDTILSKYGLHPKEHLLGSDHHTDVPFTPEDTELGELSWYLGGLFVDKEDGWSDGDKLHHGRRELVPYAEGPRIKRRNKITKLEEEKPNAHPNHTKTTAS